MGKPRVLSFKFTECFVTSNVMHSSISACGAGTVFIKSTLFINIPCHDIIRRETNGNIIHPYLPDAMHFRSKTYTTFKNKSRKMTKDAEGG